MVCHIQANRRGSSNVFSLVIVCDGSRSIPTGVTVTVTDANSTPMGCTPSLPTAINSAIDAGASRSRPNATAIRTIDVSAEFRTIRDSVRSSLRTTSVGTTTRTQHGSANTVGPPNSRPRPQPEVVTRPRAPTAVTVPRRTTTREAPRPARVVPTRAPAEVSLQWLSGQLGAIPRERNDRLGAITNLYNAREQIIPFLNTPANSNQVIISTFNTLYQIPLFRSYLNMPALTPELTQRFESLQANLDQNGLPASADAATLRSALVYIRYFAYCFAPTSVVLGGAAFRGEIAMDTSPVEPNSAGGLHRASRFYYLSERAQGRSVPTGWGTGFIYNSPNLNQVLDPAEANGLMDADTLIAAGLISRRWHAVHPPTGQGVEIGTLRQWQAPAVVGQAATTEPVPTAIEVNRIGIIGDSITQGGFGRNLATIAGRSVTVDSFGVSGQGSGPIARRFQRDILDHTPAFNTVIIEAGVNDLPSSANINTISTNISGMISAARARGMRVIVVPILPWAGYSTSSERAQNLTTDLNNWLRTQNDGNNVTVLDVSPLADPANPARMRANYTGDGLHPNREGNQALAQLIFDQAVSPNRITPAAQYANTNWNGLSARIANDVRQSGPAGIVDLIRTVSTLHPSGTASLDAALTTANRTDLKDAFITLFNEVLNNNNSQLGREFARFIAANSSTYPSTLLGSSVRLSAASDPNTISLCVRAAQNFLNSPTRNGQLGTDLGYAFGEHGLNIQPRDRVNSTGIVDLATLVGLAAYNYRLANLGQRIPSWAVTLGYQPAVVNPNNPDGGTPNRVRLSI